MKAINDIGQLYDQPYIEHDDVFECPVCHKKYKRKSSMEKHMEEQMCYDVKDLFEGTLIETKAFSLYKAILNETKPNNRARFTTFKKSPLYGPVIRFTVFCSTHEVKCYDTYFAWLWERHDHVMNVLSNGLKESNLREFRIFLHQNDLIDSKSFIEKYGDDLIADSNFFVRSIEKALIHITDDFVINNLYEGDVLPEHRLRIEELMNEVFDGQK